MNSNLLPIAGAFGGMLIWTYNIGSIQKVIYRVNSRNENEISIRTIRDYLFAPISIGTEQFRLSWGIYPLLWNSRFKMLGLNWIFMLLCGGAYGYLLKYILNMKKN